MQDTYDIICEDPYHNFVANGIVVHNSGKSVKAAQDAYYLDPTITLDRVTFNCDDFKKTVLNASKGQAIILDEAYGSLSSRGAMSNVNRTIVKMLTTIRRKNLFIFVVLPTFFELDKYVAIWRSRALMHVIAPNFQRGQFEFYDKDKKKLMYILGRDRYNYAVQPPNFRATFTSWFPFDWDAYDEKKEKTANMEEEAQSPTAIARGILEMVTRNVYKPEAKLIEVTQRTVSNYVKERETKEA
jgi:hypothetical protein